MLDEKARSRVIVKLIRNSAKLHVADISLKTMIFGPKEMLGILDLTPIENYEIKRLCIAVKPNRVLQI